MSEDEEFRGYYPGSKQPLPAGPTTPKKRPPVVTGWDERPVIKPVRGKEVELFTIGAVCQALGRPHVTIRHWTRKGYIPLAPFRMPERNGIEGRRLYAREHIESLVRCAQKHGLLDAPRIDWSKHTDFTAEVREAWKQINATYLPTPPTTT